MLTVQLRLRHALNCGYHRPVKWGRSLLTLAIETSCDDTSVALLEKLDTDGHSEGPAAVLHYHGKITSNNKAYKGVHPIVALESHQQNLAKLVQAAVIKLPNIAQDHSDTRQCLLQIKNGHSSRRIPDFISVARGPGMRSNLSTGLDTAKGLAVAWQVPIIGVNHMEAHALTPRLASALSHPATHPTTPDFPFLSLLISGGHTMLLESTSLANHVMMASTCDIAIGDAIDKIARTVLPEDILASSNSTMYGPVLEQFAFPNGEADHNYIREMGQHVPEKPDWPWNWTIRPPFSSTRAGIKMNAMEYSFCGIESRIKQIMAEERIHPMSIRERQALARHAMLVAFEHLASRIVLTLQGPMKEKVAGGSGPRALVVSGGVAANKFLCTVLRGFLASRGYPALELIFPPLELCTDNAAMIGWAGIELFKAGWHSDLSIQALRKWSLDPRDNGGILGAQGWINHGRA